MILNSAPQDQAVLSNVGEIGEFRIRNSAKAFNILSSGLYANKIRAVVRELSCNACDSHVAADKSGTPFDVHLPTNLEPWFAIRDYGTGLSHEQVTNIYTTYFESTKTASNEFIGALGLGSKSPFSYTDNFTVTAIKDGKKGIYSAFINAEGVPSIAQMMVEDTTEPNGVEVKFSVNDRWDFSKFADEARTVYTYFKLRPVVSGASNFQFRDVEYDTKNIIPGVHSVQHAGRSLAVMGNIAYPIDMPNAEQTLGDLRNLLGCGLELHFTIGELDFQASREGLSYIPQTIASIKAKLEALNAQLAIHIAEEANKIENLWDRAVYLSNKKNTSLWGSAIKKYATDSKLPTFDISQYGGTRRFEFTVNDLATKFNIELKGVRRDRGSKTLPSLRTEVRYSDTRNAQGHYDTATVWPISVTADSHFIVNDTKIGATERVKYHYRETPADVSSRVLHILEPVDRSKPMKTVEFFNAICNPPTDRVFNASTLLQKPRKESGLGKNVTILVLQERGNGGYYREREMVWRDAGKADSFDTTETFYYMPLSGFAIESKFGMINIKEFYNDLRDCGVTGLKQTIYGVRKGDIAFIKTQKNWVNIEDHISASLKVVDNKLMMSLAVQAIDSYNHMQYNKRIVNAITDTNSSYVKFVTQFVGHDKIKYSESSLKRLCNRYAPGVNFNPEAFVKKFVDECATVSKQYPLLAYLRSAPDEEVAKYINMIDTQKGI